MSEPDLQTALERDAGLSPVQARGVLGVLLRKLRDRLSAPEFDRVAAIVPEPADCLRAAPKTGGGLLGGLAALGGEKARLLMEMNQALGALGIPPSRARTIGETLKTHVETRHPDLVPLFRDLLG
jgi:hypothetical protein